MEGVVKPRVHWVSPLPPARTDIAHYTRRILPALAQATDLTLWTDAPHWDHSLDDFCPVRWLDPDHITPRDFACAGQPNARPAPGPQAVFVNIGNAVDFHAGFLRLIQRIPSIVVLHDMAIQDLCMRAIGEGLLSREVYENTIAQWHGPDGLNVVRDVFKGLREVDELTETMPGFEITLARAVSVLTHTPVVRDAVAATDTVPTYLADLPFAPSDMAPPTSRSALGPLRIVQFGYIGTNRRIHKVLEALALLRGEVDFHLDIMGSLWDPDYIALRVEELGLRPWVTLHGFVEETELDRRLRAAHLVLNLRYPTMGEASGSLMRIWNAGAAAVVTDLGWYAALPDETVFKINHETEMHDLQDLLRRLAADREAAQRVGTAGRAALEAYHTPARYAARVAEIAAHFAKDASAATYRRCLTALAP